MEPKFVNQFTRTDEVDHEVLRYTSFQSPSSIIAYGATGLTVLMLLIYFIPFPPSFPSLDNKDTIITGLALCCFGFVLAPYCVSRRLEFVAVDACESRESIRQIVHMCSLRGNSNTPIIRHFSQVTRVV